MTSNNILNFKHDKEQQQFILLVDNEKAYISYDIKEGIMYLTHLEVPVIFRGKGIGKELVERTFEYISQHNIKAEAVCSYTKHIRNKNSKWHQVIG